VSETGTGLWSFLKERKKFWLLPLILVLVLFGVLVLLSVGSEGNFVYTLN
jgi:competence protein ComGC